MNALTPITVLGGGSWGTALAIHLARIRQPVRLWVRCPKHAHELLTQRCNARYLPQHILASNIEIHHQLDTALHQVTDILCAVPSHAFHSVVQQCLPYINDDSGFVWASKGLDPQKGSLLSSIATQYLAPQNLAVLSGPSFAKELAEGLPTAIVIASNNPQFSQRLVKRFNHHQLRIYLSHDLIGVQLGGALKNVYAIAAGMSDGLKFGSNARTALITRSLAEMTRLGVAMEAKQQSFMGLAGVGDLMLTCSDNQSRNRRFGLALGQGENIADAERNIQQVIEGKSTAARVLQLAQKFDIEMPIVEQICRCLSGQSTPHQALQQLLSRHIKTES